MKVKGLSQLNGVDNIKHKEEEGTTQNRNCNYGENPVISFQIDGGD